MDKNVTPQSIAGVSIVEIMISLVLVALALIAVTSVFPNIMGHRKGIHEAEQAQIIAEEALEFLQNGGYTCSEIYGGSDDFNGTYGDANPIPMGATVYTVKKGAILCSGDLYTAVIEVSWKKSGKDHKIKVTGALR